MSDLNRNHWIFSKFNCSYSELYKCLDYKLVYVYLEIWYTQFKLLKGKGSPSGNSLDIS